MENQLVKIQDKQEELQSIEEMVAGCDSAVVTYGVDKNYNVHKVVTLFSREIGTIYQFEEYRAAHSKTLAMHPQLALVKGIDYKIEGKKVKRYSRDYFKQLFRTLFGFVKDGQTQDLRYMYEQKNN